MTDTRRFFDALFAHKPRDLPGVLWLKGESKRTLYPLNAERATRMALEERDASDVYVGVGLAPKNAHKIVGPRGRPNKQQVSGIVGLWADIDVNGGPEEKTGAAPDKPAALQLAHALLTPSVVVDSGYGLQAYWLFDEPWLFGDSAEERAGAQELAAKWLKALAAQCDYTLDATHDPTRVMRVPGTLNHKGGLNADVLLVELDDDARYEPQAFEPHVADVQMTLTPNGNGAAPVDSIVVEIRPDAAPPLDKLDALRDIDQDFADSITRKRTDQKAAKWTASEYDLSLADRAARTRWTDQEITDLLVWTRRKHGDDLKRPEYYARTIARVRATITIDAVKERRAEAIQELVQPPVSADDHDPSKVLALFEEVVGVPLTAFVQYGRDPDEGGTFELVLAGPHAGRKVRFPNFDELVRPDKFRNRIATATSVLPDRVKGADWDDVIRALLRVVQVHDEPGETTVGVLEGWLTTYVGASEIADRGEALRSGYPHTHDDKLYVNGTHLRNFLRTRFGERLTRRDVSSLLKSAGFVSEHVSYRKSDGKVSSTSLFARAVESDESE